MGFIGGATASKVGIDTIKRLSKYPRAREIFTKLENKAKKANLNNFDTMADKFSESGKMENLTLQIITPKETKQPLVLRKELHKTLKPIFNKPLTNKHDGRVAYISSKKVGKIASKDAINTSLKNGFTQEQHFETAKHLKELYENAYLREIQPDKQGEKNLQIPRYEAKFTLDGQVAIAKITLKETLTGLYKGNKIYTLELESVARLPSEP